MCWGVAAEKLDAQDRSLCPLESETLCTIVFGAVANRTQ